MSCLRSVEAFSTSSSSASASSSAADFSFISWRCATFSGAAISSSMASDHPSVAVESRLARKGGRFEHGGTRAETPAGRRARAGEAAMLTQGRARGNAFPEALRQPPYRAGPAERLDQRLHRPAGGRMAPAGRQIAERQQHKRALMQAGMRQFGLPAGAPQPGRDSREGRDRPCAGALRAPRTRPKPASTSSSASSSAGGGSALSTSATALTYQGWPLGGAGALSYQGERLSVLAPRAASAASAAASVACGGPCSGDGRFAPNPIRIIPGGPLSRGGVSLRLAAAI